MIRDGWRAGWVAAVLALAACGDDAAGAGKVRVQITADATSSEGLARGDGDEDARDYAVRYTKYLLVVGDVELNRTGADDRLRDDTRYVVDLMKVGEQGVELTQFSDVAAGQWDGFAYSTPKASKGLTRIEVSEEDAKVMADNGYTYWIEGVVESDPPVQFVLQVDAPTRFTNCTRDGEPGVSVVEDGTTAVSITIHGDHLWFNAFPSDSEGAITRQTGWMVEADRDGDGIVRTEDLEQLDALEVFTAERGYNLAGAPPLDSALDWVRAQLATQGHYQGEGECDWAPDTN